MNPKKLHAAILAGLVLAASPVWGAAPEKARRAERRQGVTGERGWLGLLLVDALDGGVEVVAVVPGSPADGAGMRTGDLLLEVNGRAVVDRPSLRRILQPMRPGDTIEVGILRGGGMERKAVQAGRRSLVALLRPESAGPPDAPPAVPAPQVPVLAGPWSGATSLGMSLAAIPSPLRLHYGAPGDTGVLVTRVAEDGPASRAGVRVGDLLVRLDGEEIRVPLDPERRLLSHPAGAEIVLELVRERRPLVVKLKGEVAAPPRGLAPPVAPRRPVDVRVREIEEEIRQLRRKLVALQAELEKLERRQP